MNRCDYCLENLSSYIDQEMSEHEIKEVEEHLKQCDSCALELDILKTIVSTCSELLEELPEGYSSSLHTKLEKAKEEKAKKDKRATIRMFSQIAAGFIIVITLGIVVRAGFFDNRLMMKNQSTSESAPMAISGVGSSEQRITADGLDKTKKSADNVTDDTSTNSSSLAMQRAEGSDNGQPYDKTDNGFSASHYANDSDGEKVNEDPGTMLYFSEDSDGNQDKGYVRAEDYDTVVTITVADVGNALESIMAIDEKFEQPNVYNMDYLEDSIIAYRGGERKKLIELKLIYVDQDVWQGFLAEMELIFPDITIDSVPSEDDQQYVRVIIQQEK